ncbi:MAG: hypothetical protein HRF46_15120, partial [Acidobacteriota bacterium]
FLTLEDETGFANVVIMPDLFRARRAVLAGAALLEAEGVVQARDGVLTLRAEEVRPLFASAPAPPSRDFH